MIIWSTRNKGSRGSRARQPRTGLSEGRAALGSEFPVHWLPHGVRTTIRFTEAPEVLYMLQRACLSAHMLPQSPRPCLDPFRTGLGALRRGAAEGQAAFVVSYV